MTREEIISQLTPIARAMLKDENLELIDDLSAANVPTWTSLSFMMLLTEIENQFGFKFKMMEILKLQNMGAIIDSIQTHVE
ncbi:MAG: acyl carrier protein [Paludibacteraceae bacterium]|nr:acyl carrier protein [Paludibacteraceae bacterium]